MRPQWEQDPHLLGCLSSPTDVTHSLPPTCSPSTHSPASPIRSPHSSRGTFSHPSLLMCTSHRIALNGRNKRIPGLRGPPRPILPLGPVSGPLPCSSDFLLHSLSITVTLFPLTGMFLFFPQPVNSYSFLRP